jgi:NADPH-dependent ferric siderophore reductase
MTTSRETASTARAALASEAAIKPERALVAALTVLGSERISPGFQRVTLHGSDEALGEDFRSVGGDHWLRLFLPHPSAGLHLPWGGLDGWYSRWLAQEEEVRASIRNYTIREARRIPGGWELDIDVVLHIGADGRIDGLAGRWAQSVRPGAEVGALDQGCIMNAPGHEGPMLLIADETGVPGIEGIARALHGARTHPQRRLGHLPETARVPSIRYVLEVPSGADRRPLAGTGADEVEATWLPREQAVPADAVPGVRLLETVRQEDIPADAYVYIVGEAKTVLEIRRRARAAGVSDDRIHFCSYWRRSSPRR